MSAKYDEFREKKPLASSFSAIGLVRGVPVPIPSPPNAEGSPNPVPGLGTRPIPVLKLPRPAFILSGQGALLEGGVG
jgi:hypothetical protein